MAPSDMSFAIVLLVAFAAASTPSAAFSLPAILPCIPGFPRIPLFPCKETQPLQPPTDCRPAVMKMVPACTGFLTNSSVKVPPRNCCDTFDSVGSDGAAICYCHVANGDIQKLLPAPVNSTRVISIAAECGIILGMDSLAEQCDTFDVPPMTVPPSAPPAV